MRLNNHQAAQCIAALIDAFEKRLRLIAADQQEQVDLIARQPVTRTRDNRA